MKTKKMIKATKHGVVNYPIGDFLIQIKNAALARRKIVTVRSTKLVKSVADALKKEGYLADVTRKEGEIITTLAYHKKEPVLMGLKLVSRPGLRIYKRTGSLKKLRGYSTFILSTPKGIMTAKQATKENLGGEMIVEVW